MELLAGEQLDEPDFAGAPDVGAAAGAKIQIRESDDPHLAGQLLFTPVGQRRQLLLGGPENLHLRVPPDGLVGPGLDFRQGLRLHGTVEIDGHGVVTHVEAHVVIAKAGVDQAADNVLAAVLLHQVEPPVPVDLALHGFANLQRMVAVVDDPAAGFVGIGDPDTAQDALVAGLAAALGIKRRPVQNHVVAVLPRLAGQDHGGKLRQMGIEIIELFGGHGNAPSFGDWDHCSTDSHERERKNNPTDSH